MPKISAYKNWNTEVGENKSKEMKTHGYKEISHQKPGHYDTNNDENNDNNEKGKENEEQEKVAE